MSAEARRAAPDRLPELDGVRGIAVLMVILFHAFFFSMKQGGSLASWPLPARVMGALTHPGWLGVDLFFVLSGFLITGILVETRGSPRYFRNFYGRRVLRILPLYYLLLGAILLCYSGSRSFVLLSLVYLSNLTSLFGVTMIYGSLWSLSVEEHFYLVWPLVVKVIGRGRTGRTRLALLALLLIIGEPLLRGWGYTRGSDTYSYSWFRLDGLAFGALLAIFIRAPFCTRRRLLLLGAGEAFLGLCLFVFGAPFGILTRGRLLGVTLQYSAAQLGFSGLIAAALGGAGTRPMALLRARPLRRCGDLSYCLYLIHLLVFHLYDSLLLRLHLHPEAALSRFGALLLRAGGALLASFLLAELSFRYFEIPVLRLKRYFTY